jgi:sec-independent protein translocase protein TatA
MFDPSAPHIIILMIVVLLLFGSSRLPGAAKALGQSMHIFKRSMAGMENDDQNAAAGGTAANPVTTTLPPALPISQQPYSTPQQFTAPQPAATQQAAPVQDSAAQIQELQRQVEELQRQTAGGAAGQSSQSF